jgi:hypothetical protein
MPEFHVAIHSEPGKRLDEPRIDSTEERTTRNVQGGVFSDLRGRFGELTFDRVDYGNGGILVSDGSPEQIQAVNTYLRDELRGTAHVLNPGEHRQKTSE